MCEFHTTEQDGGRTIRLTVTGSGSGSAQVEKLKAVIMIKPDLEKVLDGFWLRFRTGLEQFYYNLFLFFKRMKNFRTSE